MDEAEVQVQNAIDIAWNPTADQTLKAQAFEYLHHLRTNPSSAQVCLNLFVREPLLGDVVRHVSLEVVNNALQTEQLDLQGLQQVHTTLFEYAQRQYGVPNLATGRDSVSVQKKLAQTLTFAFESLYESGWETFFDDMRSLASNGSGIDMSRQAGILLYLRVLASVHDEIADQLVNTTQAKQKAFTELKDLIRQRDVVKIAASWLEILSNSGNHNAAAVELCLRTMSRWVSWIDIALVVNEASISRLFEIAAQQSPNPALQSTAIRDAAIDVFTEIIAKKMKPAEKIELIQFINLNGVIAQLTASRGLDGALGTPKYDTDMAETVAKLVNNAATDIIKILDSNDASSETRAKAEQSLLQFVPHILRYFGDEYDEVCSTVIPALNDLLAFFRKLKNSNQLPAAYHAMVQPILSAIITKMRYDDTSSWSDENDETDEAEFQELRKRLRVLQQVVATIDEQLYIETLNNVVTPIFMSLKSQATVDWRDVDVAMTEMYLLGELALRNGGLYQKRKPSSVASAKLIDIMILMIECVQLQYMETCVRQTAFFEQHPHYVGKVLEDFVRFVHDDHIKIRARSHLYFLRLSRDLKAHIGAIAEKVIRSIQDLMIVKAEVTDEGSSEDMSSNENSQSADALFNAQLHLFEAVGCIASAPNVPPELQAALARSIIEPLSTEMIGLLPSTQQGDEFALLQVHHLIMATGTLARGFSDWVPGKARGQVAVEVSDEFLKGSNSILEALAATKSSLTIRTAARFTFSRMIGVLGYRVLEQLPQWIDGLLSESSTKDEMAAFLKLLDQIVFGFKAQISGILDSLFAPLMHRIFAGLSEPATGTDDDIQLGELRREYLNFFLVLLNNELESVLVTPANQPIFETVINSIEHFAREYMNNPDAKLAMAVLTRLCAVWGGPDISNPMSNPAPAAPALPGFDQFMITRFSALTWQLVSGPGFDPKESNAHRLLGEIASLQQMILAKTGQEYLSWLRNVELKNLGLQSPIIDEYLAALTTKDHKGFKQFLLTFLQRGRE